MLTIKKKSHQQCEEKAIILLLFYTSIFRDFGFNVEYNPLSKKKSCEIPKSEIFVTFAQYIFINGPKKMMKNEEKNSARQ